LFIMFARFRAVRHQDWPLRPVFQSANGSRVVCRQPTGVSDGPSSIH
jgi:hypothetical protein